MNLEGRSGRLNLTGSSGVVGLHGSASRVNLTGRKGRGLIEDVIGITGPGGGMVFYDKGEVTDGWRYMEVTKFDLSTGIKWQDPRVMIGPTAQGTAIGTGKDNTAAIVAWLVANGQTDRAALICDNLVSGGKSDWFLPSEREMQEVYLQRSYIELTSGVYWTSTEQPGDGIGSKQNAVEKDFSIFGSGGTASKALNKRVRAIRQFESFD